MLLQILLAMFQVLTYILMWVYCNLFETIMVVRNQSVFAFSLWVMHVYIETLILFDENLLKITKKS
jgi:hypothetical protein